MMRQILLLTADTAAIQSPITGNVLIYRKHHPKMVQGAAVNYNTESCYRAVQGTGPIERIRRLIGF